MVPGESGWWSSLPITKKFRVVIYGVAVVLIVYGLLWYLI